LSRDGGTVTGSTLRSHGPPIVMLVADMVAALVSLEFAFFLTGGGRPTSPHLGFLGPARAHRPGPRHDLRRREVGTHFAKLPKPSMCRHGTSVLASSIASRLKRGC